MRDRGQFGGGGTIQLPRPGPATWAIIVGIGLGWLVGAMGGPEWETALALQPARLLDGHLWKPLTAVFTTPRESFAGLVLSGVFAWLYGAPLEARRGPRAVAWAFLVGGIGGNLGASLICIAISALQDDPVSMFNAELATRGPGAATLALLTAWAGTSRGMPIGLMLFGTVRAERLALILTLVMAGVMSQGGGPSPWAVLIAGGLGWLVGIGKIPPARGRGKAPPPPKHRFEVIEGGLPEGSPPVRGRGWTGGRSDDGLVH